MPGNPNSPHVKSQKPYVRIEKGTTVNAKSDEAHIPLDEFDFDAFKDILK